MDERGPNLRILDDSIETRCNKFERWKGIGYFRYRLQREFGCGFGKIYGAFAEDYLCKTFCVRNGSLSLDLL
jgi:hypothetical protein